MTEVLRQLHPNHPPADALHAEIERRLGVLPNLFRLAPETPDIAATFWDFARVAYLDNPLPSLLKERLFVYLSRFCEARYCIARHVGFLIGLGRPSGDERAAVHSIHEVVQLLRRHFPRGDELDPCLALCAASEPGRAEVPGPGTPTEGAVFACAGHVFLQTPQLAECLTSLERLLRRSDFEHLMLLMEFIRTEHHWSRVHTELTFEEDIQQLLRAHEPLADCVLNDHELGSAGVSDQSAVLRRTALALRKSEETLHARDAELATLRQVNAELHDARRAALNLMEDAVESRRQIEDLNRRLRVTASCDRFRAALADALRSLADPVQIQSVACRVLAEYLMADRVSYADVLGDGETALIPSDFRSTGAASVAGQQAIGDFGTFMDKLRAGQTIVFPDAGAEPSLTAAEQAAQRVAVIQLDSFIAVPLVKDSRLVAVLCVTQASSRAWTSHAVELAQETAERTWAAVERARAEEALRQSEDRLRRLNDALEERIRERTSELARANTSLQIEVHDRRAAEREIKALFKRLVSAQEEERRRIARDIHDQLGQQMTAVRMSLEALGPRTDAGTPLAEYVERTLRLAEELDRGIDFLTWELRPAALDHLGLPEALAHLVGGWAERFQVQADYDTIGIKGVRLPADVEANLYRLTQEALHNVYKHARATHVSVLLERRDHRIVLVVEDNGHGFAIADFSREAPSSLGLVSMRERAALVGGELTIESTPAYGTTIMVRVPIADAEDANND